MVQLVRSLGCKVTRTVAKHTRRNSGSRATRVLVSKGFYVSILIPILYYIEMMIAF
jgi:hypothetical protein